MTFVFSLDHAHHLPPAEILALVGGKAANLGVMSRELELPVPPGFVITTEACRQYLGGGWPEGLDEEIRAAMAAVEATLGRRFGGSGAGASDPLLVSVRSGAPVSMPGMMDTVLDIGVTRETQRGLAAIGGQGFAADCEARLAQMFRSTVASGNPPDDAWMQLRLAIEAVFRSWQSDRAKAYRTREHIPDDVGTAVTVQAMVFGNRDDRSGTGVLFTRNPATGEPTPYGDVMFRAQGEDVVAGTHRTEPVAVLANRLPDVAESLRVAAERLERHYADLCDIEFTIESGRLWLLQVRVGKRSPEAAMRIAVDMAEDASFPLTRADAVRRVAPLLARPAPARLAADPARSPLTVGLAASPGVATGKVVTSPEDAERAGSAGDAVILVRAETSPDDVHGMARAAGILTSRGGIASHAAVVARGWAIPAVVGADAITVAADGIEVAGRRIAVGAVITIDGGSGEVHLGAVATTSVEAPARSTLLAWARDLGIEVADAVVPPAGAAGAGRREGHVAPAGAPAGEIAGADECVRALGTKGFATIDGLAEALGAGAETVREALEKLTARGDVTAAAGAYRLTDAGRARHAALVENERASVRADRAAAWLDGFLELDRRTKDTVTAWQVRESEPGTEPALNDHTDADYDQGVLERLGELAADADVWLADVANSIARFASYRRRLATAMAAAQAGDHRFVASPRVDSFHSVWFELHEDLITLAGRTRADEVAAGRA